MARGDCDMESMTCLEEGAGQHSFGCPFSRPPKSAHKCTSEGYDGRYCSSRGQSRIRSAVYFEKHFTGCLSVSLFTQRGAHHMGLINASNFTEWQESHSVRLQCCDGLLLTDVVLRSGWTSKHERTIDGAGFNCVRSHAVIFSRERIIRFSKRFRHEAENFAG